MSTFHYMLRFATRSCPALRQSTNTIRPSLNINSPRLYATGSTKRLIDAKSLSFARPTPFAHRLNKLIAQSKPFRRSYSSPNGHGNMPASYKSAKRAVRTLILINTGVFLTWAYAGGQARQTNDTKLLQSLVRNFMLTEENLAQGRYHTLITSAFSHSNFWHFGINMFALWTFGGLLAYMPAIGARHIYLLALTSSFASSSAWLIHRRSKAAPAPTTTTKSWNPFSSASSQRQTRTIEALLGASGFVMATASLSACIMPFAPMMMMGVVPMPLYAVALAYAALDLYMLDSGTSRTAHSAHLGGLAFGIVYYLVLLRKKGGVWQLISSRRR
ncbi:hypothetical protein CB0940_09618 [Cercospora beticola]|uniref:Peptidase S54 rhomboid domain-containing protein n=1 Tax=Cercospora beticola TaxID=122368 RepID=A0A2G5HGP6_CERBT|nr:hypothetical protein CB0940_09618 [Cercospora beticola]PIA91675.1 hypothetical protein CB0940_09618 [Cercospora beticola]WPB06045.1 hypothetical protein RHO25_010701 [Cercospora beticola]CAK1365927.1 unnamed protein product [Cercospora beticola]